MPAAAQGGFRCAESGFERLPFRVAFTQAEVEHGTHGSGAVGGESPGVELDFAHQVGVDDAHRPTRRALRGKVVDVRDFDAVHVETVFRWAAAAHDEVVAVAHGREGHAGIAPHDARDVAVRSRAFLDFPQSDDLYADRRFSRLSIESGAHGQCAERFDVFVHFHVHFRCGGRHHVVGCFLRGIACGGHAEGMDARRDVFQQEHARRVRHRAQRVQSCGADNRPDDRLSAQAVDDFSAHVERRLRHGLQSRRANTKPYAEDSFERVDFHVAKLVIARRMALFFAYYS